jgi:hypothetical protein
MRCHEIDRLWGRLFSSNAQVCFTMTVVVIGQDNHFSATEIGDNVFNWSDR